MDINVSPPAIQAPSKGMVWAILTGIVLLLVAFSPSIANFINSNSTENNIALNKPVTQERGQVEYKDYAKIYSSKNITDGNWDLGWRTYTDLNPNTMAVIDLQGEYLINKVSFIAQFDTKPEFDREIVVQVDYSNLDNVDMDNKSHWVSLGFKKITIEDVNNIHEINFSRVRAKYIRIQYVHEDEEWGDWGNIQELMVFGKKNKLWNPMNPYKI